MNTFNTKANLEVLVYGKLELMILKHCILKTNIKYNDKCNICSKQSNYYLEDRNKMKYKIKTNKCGNTILNYKSENYLKDIKNLNITSYSISLIDIENKNMILKFIKEWENDKIYHS